MFKRYISVFTNFNMMFKRFEKNPVLNPDPSKPYESKCAYNPAAVVHERKVYLVYRAEGEDKVSSLCLAISDDGLNFRKHDDNPVIRPDIPEEKHGCEDPRITKIGDEFYMTYTAYDGQHPERCENVYTALATSNNLVHWERLGIIAKGIKSAAIFPEKVDGRYFMLIGGKVIHAARSDDLLEWEIDDEPFMSIREDKFDSKYVEVGPPPIFVGDHLVLFFNTADKKGVFHPSMAILDRNDPTKILYRADEPLMTPSEKYELEGKVGNVIFGEGLVELNGRMFYYYGGADTCVGVVTFEKKELEEYVNSLLGK